MMLWVASETAFMPLAQTLLMVVQGASLLMLAPKAAWRAGAWPRPAWRTLPMRTSSTWVESSWAFSRAPVMAMLPSLVAGTVERLPRNEPMGVRAAERM